MKHGQDHDEDCALLLRGEECDCRVPTALDFPDCRDCQMWRDAGASWARPCKQHYGGEPRQHDCGHTCCDECHDPMHDHFLAASDCPSCLLERSDGSQVVRPFRGLRRP